MTKNQSVNNNKLIGLTIAVILIMLLAFAVLSVKIESITVVGNDQCTSEEIQQYILSGRFDDSAIVVWMKSKFGKKVEIPFVQKYDIDFNSSNSITINIYEKNLVGYIDYMGTYMYFDKDGIVVESSESIVEGMPKITGISFDYVLLHEKLPVENEKVFNVILNVTQTLKKNDLVVDKIFVDEKLESILYIDDVKVLLGSQKEISDKIAELKDIFMSGMLEGKSGTLDISILNKEGTGYILKTNDK